MSRMAANGLKAGDQGEKSERRQRVGQRRSSFEVSKHAQKQGLAAAHGTDCRSPAGKLGRSALEEMRNPFRKILALDAFEHFGIGDSCGFGQ